MTVLASDAAGATRTTVPPRRRADAAPVAAIASPRVRDLLDRPDVSVRVVHAGRDAVYLDVDGWCLGVVGARASQVPCALVVAAPVCLSGVVTADVGQGRLLLRDDTGRVTPVRVGRLVDRTVPRLVRVASYDVGSRLLPLAGPAISELGRTTAQLTSLIRSAPERLIGWGSGLTPLGDDVLAGWMATGYALGEPVALPDPRGRTSLLSATLLDCAQHGEVLPEFRALVVALGGSDEERMRDATLRAAGALASVGHTSGVGLLLGLLLRLGASHVTPKVVAAR